MPFGTGNLQYGEGLGNEEDEFGAGGSSIYDEYMQDTYISDKLDAKDYLYEYDPLKEQNLLAGYMSGLTDLGDKKEEVRTKAIAERKALSKSIRGGLTSGTMETMEQEGEEAASRATAGLYRGQFGAKRQLGEDIGSLREAYEGDIAQSVEDYNLAVGEGTTHAEAAEALEAEGLTEDMINAANGDVELARYQKAFGLSASGSGTEAHGFGSGSRGTNNSWGTHGDTWYQTNTKQGHHYYDEGFWYDGHWKSGKGGHW